ncbi:MAG: TolC family protein [Muribaculaceae bacterium]|nr:TolC family protein [Muribaculaceae bacterium]
MKRKIYISLISAVMALTSITAMYAQTPDSVFTLQACRELALRNNAAMTSSENDLKAARETRREAFTKYFPEISAGASAFRANHDMLQYDVLDLITLGLIKKGKTAGVWAVQPVFMGGQIVNGNKLASVGEEVAKIRKEQTADNVVLTTDNLYWNLTSLKATKNTVESAIVMLDSLAASVGAAVDAGMVVQNDLMKVNLKRNEYRNNLVDLDNGISLMKMLLAQQMGLGATSGIDIIEEIPGDVPDMPMEMYVEEAAAVSQTADHRLLVKNVEAKTLEKRMELGNYLPKVGVGAGWFYHDVLNQNHNFGAIMVTVAVPLSGWWGGSHAIRKKNLELENAKTELDNLTQKLQIEIADKWDNLTGAWRKMQLSSQDIEQSKENLRITRAYYEAGMNTITDLLDAQTLHVESQNNYIAAYGEFQLSISQYLNATARLHP